MGNDERAVLAILDEAKKLTLRRKATIDWKAVGRDWAKYFESFAGENWRHEFIPLFEGVAQDQADNWAAAFGIRFDIDNPFAQPFIADYSMTFSEPILDTTQDDLKQMLAQALANGWTIDEMSKQINLTWERYLDPAFTLDGRRLTEDEAQWFIDRSPRFRRDLIARDQTMRVSNASSFYLFAGYGAERKEWLDSGDDRVRPAHREAGARYREGGDPGPIPISEPFIVGGSPMMYPGDSSLGAPIELFIQDRCAIAPFIAEMEEVPTSRARFTTEEEVVRTGSLWEPAVGSVSATAKRKIQDAYDELRAKTPDLIPTEIVLMDGAGPTGSEVWAIYMGNGKVGVTDAFLNDLAIEFGSKDVGGRLGILLHEMGHSLEDGMTTDQKIAWSRIWRDTKDRHKELSDQWAANGFKPDESPLLTVFPSAQAQAAWAEDLAETYRVFQGVGRELGHIDEQRLAILRELLKRPE